MLKTSKKDCLIKKSPYFEAEQNIGFYDVRRLKNDLLYHLFSNV